MDDSEVSILFTNDEVYVIPDIVPDKAEINADLLLLVSTSGKKENCEEIISRLLQSLASLNKDICARYDIPLTTALKYNCRRIVTMGYSSAQTGLHADFSLNKIIYFKEKYILPAEDLVSIDKDSAKKKQFWKLLQELLLCGD